MSRADMLDMSTTTNTVNNMLSSTMGQAPVDATMNDTTVQRGLFIVFEGGDGAGKSTQIRLLENQLTQAGVPVLVTSEPGGTKLGATIRELLLNPNHDMHPVTEALLFAADRAEHAATVIRPALTAGKVVISSRYMDSSIAYQSAGRGLHVDHIETLSMWATNDLVPDMTFVLDVSPTVGLARAARTEFGQLDRIEQETNTFAMKVRAEFLRLAAREPERYTVLDASRHQHAVTSDVLAVVRDLWTRNHH